jgi:hypothetical protein
MLLMFIALSCFPEVNQLLCRTLSGGRKWVAGVALPVCEEGEVDFWGSDVGIVVVGVRGELALLLIFWIFASGGPVWGGGFFDSLSL